MSTSLESSQSVFIYLGRSLTAGSGTIRGIPVDFLTQVSHTGSLIVSGSVSNRGYDEYS